MLYHFCSLLEFTICLFRCLKNVLFLRWSYWNLSLITESPLWVLQNIGGYWFQNQNVALFSCFWQWSHLGHLLQDVAWFYVDVLHTDILVLLLKTVFSKIRKKIRLKVIYSWPVSTIFIVLPSCLELHWLLSSRGTADACPAPFLKPSFVVIKLVNWKREQGLNWALPHHHMLSSSVNLGHFI